MAAEVSTSQLLHGYSRLLHRYHVVLFVVIAFGGLAVVILLLSQIANSSSDTTGASQSAATADFDKATITRLENLKQTGSSKPLQFPGNTRINPFVE